MSDDKYCIRHVDGTREWTLKEWVPGRFLRIGSRYKVIKTFGTEAAAVAHMKKIAEPLVEWKHYDKNGGENVGGW